MKIISIIKFSFLFALFLFLTSCAQISGHATLFISVDKPIIRPGEEVEFTINAVGPSVTDCNVKIEYHGLVVESLSFRFSRDGVRLPYKFRKTFNTEGAIDVVATANEKPEYLGECIGKASVSLLIVNPQKVVGNKSDESSPVVVEAQNQISKEALTDLRQKAAKGNLDAMFSLGNVLANRKEDVEAFKWFSSAANRGHAAAMNSVGFMYEEGRGVLQNYKTAEQWYGKAVQRGNPSAMINRGLLYLKGLGVTESKLQAYIHFNLAARYAKEQSLREASIKLRDEVAKELKGAQLTTAQTEASRMASRIK